MKLIFVFWVLLIPILTFLQDTVQDFEPLDFEKVSADIDTIKTHIDSCTYYVRSTINVLSEEVKLFGWKKTVQINSGIFLPLVVFVILYLIWLWNRRFNK